MPKKKENHLARFLPLTEGRASLMPIRRGASLSIQYMNKKHVLVALVVGVVVGYMAQNYIRKIPVVNKLPVLGGTS